MEAIEYNGIELKALQTIRWHRQHLRDAADNYTMTRHEIEIFASLNPGQTSYLAGDPPVATPGRMPGPTDVAIRDKLSEPRGLLKVTSSGTVILETPAFIGPGPERYDTDAKNGPFCEFVSPAKQIGLRHWLLHLRFLAHTVECTEVDSPVVSNTWGIVWDVDELCYPTKTVSGTAILRTDYLRDGHVTADSFRASFSFPIPENYVRENVHVELSEDGSTLLYSYTDRGRCYNISATGPVAIREIRKIDVFRTTRSDAGTPARATAETRLARRLGFTGVGGLQGAGVQGVFDLFSLGHGSYEARRLANLPSHVLNVRADLWGERNASIMNLTRFGLGICLHNSYFSGVPFNLTTAEVIIMQELTDRFCSCQITYRWADNLRPGSGVNTNLGADQGGGAVMLNSVVRNYPTIKAKDPSWTDPVSPADPSGTYEILTQTDGTNPFQFFAWIQKSVVQALLSPCDAVPDPDLAGDRS